MTLDRVLDLDHESRERLRALLSERSAVSAGQLVIVGLQTVRARLGESWQRYCDRVHVQAEKVLSHVLEPTEVFLRLGEDRYVIVFHERDQAAAQVICEKIVRDVAEVFLGAPDMKGLTADGVFMMLDAATMAHSLGLDLSPAGDAGELSWEDIPEAPSHGGVQTVQRPAAAPLPHGAVAYIPVWDMTHSIVYTYKPSILAMRGRRRVSGYHALEDARDARAVRSLDLDLLRAAAAEIEAGAARGVTTIMTVPVSFQILANRGTALDYFGQCASLPERVRRQTIFEVAHLNPGTPVWRAYEVLSTLKRFSRGLFLRIDQSWRDFAILKELPFRGLVFDVEMDMRPCARISADIERAAAEARTRNWAFAVAGVYSHDLTQAARAAGARFVYGHYLVAAVSKPLPAAALDWLGLERLTGSGPRLRPANLDELGAGGAPGGGPGGP